MMKEFMVAGVITLAATWAVWRLMERPAAPQPMSRWTRWLYRSVSLCIVGSAAWLRCAGANRLLWGHDEIVHLLEGMRLHLLPWFNLGDPVERNFFKSLAMSNHGLGDSVFFYLVVAAFRLFHLPVSESHLFLAGASLSIATLVLLFWFVRRLFGTSVGLVVMAFAAWNRALIAFATNGFQLNFVIFLQIAIFAGYALHVSANRWRTSLLATLLMIFCAGSELLYLAPVLVMFHAASLRVLAPVPQSSTGRHTPAVGWWDAKNLFVWSGFGLMMLVNLFLFLKVGSRIDLTLLGHFFRKRQIEGTLNPGYGLSSLVGTFHDLVKVVPGFAYVVIGSIGVLLLGYQRSSRPFTTFVVAYLLLIGFLTYAMKLTHGFNTLHLLLPAIIVVGVAAVTLVTGFVKRIVRLRGASEAVAGVLCVLLLMGFARPWKRPPGPEVPEAYRGIKAAAAAVRMLGSAPMRVLVLSPHPFIPSTMEYYLGLAASSCHGAPIHLFYLRDTTDQYLPSRLARRLGFDTFDYAIEFVKEGFPGKAAFREDLARGGLKMVAEVTDGGEASVRVYSPHPVTPLRLSLEEGNRAFEHTYARWERLFSDAHAGLFFYFGADY